MIVVTGSPTQRRRLLCCGIQASEGLFLYSAKIVIYIDVFSPIVLNLHSLVSSFIVQIVQILTLGIIFCETLSVL
jgi:hypothetical protein